MIYVLETSNGFGWKSSRYFSTGTKAQDAARNMTQHLGDKSYKTKARLNWHWCSVKLCTASSRGLNFFIKQVEVES